jgi:calnexin
MTDEILFDNFIIADNVTVVEDFTTSTWEMKSFQERSSSSTGQSILQAIKDATNERPWLWAVFILVVVLPIVLIITYCCTGSAKPEDIDAHKKKFDDPTPDSPEVIEEEDEDATKEEVKDDSGKDGGAGGDQDDVAGGNTVEAGAAGDGSPAEDQADEGDDERDAEGSPKKSNSPRKRRNRKE